MKPTNEATTAFHVEVQRLVGRFRSEWALGYAACVGVLAQVQFDVQAEWKEEDDD